MNQKIGIHKVGIIMNHFEIKSEFMRAVRDKVVIIFAYIARYIFDFEVLHNVGILHYKRASIVDFRGLFDLEKDNR